MTETTTETTENTEHGHRTDYHDAEQDIHRFLYTHIACPYTVEVEKKAWCEGYIKASRDTTEAHGYLAAHNERDNPYTSGDTTVAWHQGYEDYAYKPAPFNPVDIPVDADVTVRLNVTSGDTWERRARLLWTDNAWSGGDRRQPWADNREDDRCVWLPWATAQWLIKAGLFNTVILPDASVELPCPPYTYEYERGGMSISAGKFTKWGSKEDWQNVVSEMQEKIDEMPEGIDISDGYVDIDVVLKVSTAISVPMSVLVDNEDGVFEGDEDQLHDAIVEAIEYQSFDYDWQYDADIDMSYAEVDEMEPNDVTYNIGQL